MVLLDLPELALERRHLVKQLGRDVERARVVIVLTRLVAVGVSNVLQEGVLLFVG